MAAASDIGANFSNRKGDAQLGGYNAGVIPISTSPIEQMAHYAVMYNKSQWEQQQVDTQNKVNELAKIGQLNPNNAIAKDKPETLAAYNDLVKYGQEYARKVAKNPEEKVQYALEWQSKLADAGNKITSANARALGYNAQKADIEGNVAYNAKQKKILLDQLEKRANSTDIFTPIQALAPKFDLKIPKIGDPTYLSFDILRNSADGNGKETVNFKLFDPSNINSSYLEAQGLKGLQDRKATTDLEQTQFDLENASDNSQQVWNDSSSFLNQAIADPKYKKGEQINIEAIQSDNPMVGNIIGLANKWNDYANTVKENIAKGVYNDENGVSQVDPKKYFTIDPAKGISPAQLVYLEKFSKANPDATDVKYVHTGDANTAQKNAQDYEVNKQKASTDAIYKKAIAGATVGKAKAYIANVGQQMKIRKTQEAQNQMLDDLYTRNLTQQPTLVKGVGNGQVQLKIDAATSLPLFTFNGKNATQLRPIGATAIGVDGQPITDESVNTKVDHYEGGHYVTQYVRGGKPISYPEISKLYVNFKKVMGSKWQGSLDDFLKQSIEDKGTNIDVRIIGANGTTDRALSTAAQRAISNQATGKGETPVFSSDDSADQTEE